MKYEIENVYPSESINEFSVAINGLSYLVIFGRHVNGGFCALPRNGVSCELSAHDDFGDIGYNTESINGKRERYNMDIYLIRHGKTKRICRNNLLKKRLGNFGKQRKGTQPKD